MNGIILGIIVLAAALFFLATGVADKILQLVKLSPGIDKAESGTLNEEVAAKQPQKDISGQFGTLLIVKMEQTAFEIRPTSKDHCLVGANLKNTGKTNWEESDKIRASLFCNYEAKANQVRGLFQVQNYPSNGYLTGLKPGEQIAVTFGRAPNNCLKSLDTYNIVLYSNCEGSGNTLQPCDNFESSSNPPKEINKVEFKCPIS